MDSRNFLRFLVILKLMLIVKCQLPQRTSEDLRVALARATEFFEKLKDKYESQLLTSDTWEAIDNEIDRYIKSSTESIRQKREVRRGAGVNKDINVLNGFRDILTISFTNVQDVICFPFTSDGRIFWFVATMNSSGISFFQLKGDKLQQIYRLPKANGTRIIAETCNFGTFLILQKLDTILIYRLHKTNGTYGLLSLQELEITGEVHANLWRGMNQLYLGIVSSSKIWIYTWLGEHFDLVETLNFGTKQLISFQNKGFLHLAATGLSTRVLKYSLRFNEFVVLQRLPESEDIDSFAVKENRLEERYLILKKNFTILYKEVNGRFVPFQKLLSRIRVSVTVGKVILLFSLENEVVTAYQYNGWKFLELKVKLFEVNEIRKVHVYGEELLIVKHKNGDWKLIGFDWINRKALQNLREEIKEWCFSASEKVKRMPPEVPELTEALRVTKGFIKELRTQNINSKESETLRTFTKEYEKVVSSFQKQKDILKQKMTIVDPKFQILRAKKVSVNCETNCRINKLNVRGETKPFARFKKSMTQNEDLEFRSLKISNLDDWRCPILALNIDEIVVNKSINNVSLKHLQENALKVVGDQEVSGEHSINSINATIALMPLDLATNFSKQILQMNEVKAKEFHSTESGILLPLNGTPITMTGTMEAKTVKLKGLVELNGKIDGKGYKRISPLKQVFHPLTLENDYFFQNVKVESILKAKDVSRNAGKSLKQILSNSVSLQSNVSTHLLLSSNQVKWESVSLLEPWNWVTAHSTHPLIISGVKYAMRNVVVSDAVHSSLPTPKLETELCSTAAVTPGIRMTTMVIDEVNIRNLHSSNTYGAHDLSNIILDSATSENVQNIQFSAKRFDGSVRVKSVVTSSIEGVNLKNLQRLMDGWVPPNYFNKSIKTSSLTVNSVRNSFRLSIPVPAKMKNAVSKRNLYIGSINGIDAKNFMMNVININDMISLGNVTFANGFACDSIHASQAPFNVTTLTTNPNLRSKRILDTLETYSLNLLYPFSYNLSDAPMNYIINGSVMFLNEPDIENVNSLNIERISREIWMQNESTVFSGINLTIKNITSLGNTTLNGILNTPLGPWSNISQNLLSKTEPQEILVPAFFETVKARFITGSEDSVLKSSVPKLNELLENTLQRNRSFVVKGKWRFNELEISGSMRLNSTVNEMNLSTDIVRYNAQNNVVTGRKTIVELTTKNLNIKSFSRWATDVVLQTSQGHIVVKGRKTFNNIAIDKLTVFGKILGRSIGRVLLKSSTQEIHGFKKILGSVSTKNLIADGLVNDVNLTNLMESQLKKQRPIQSIETEIMLRNELRILGNLSVEGLYEGVELKDFNSEEDGKLRPVIESMKEVEKLSEGIHASLENRANYVNKLEMVETDTNLDIGTDSILILNGSDQCEIKNISLFCNGRKIIDFVLDSNFTDFILIKLTLLNDVYMIVSVRSDTVSIHSYNISQKRATIVSDLYIPGISEAFVEVQSNSLWIILRLPLHSLILHYKPWGDSQRHVLPASDTCVTTKMFNDQLLLLRDDGVWNLEGLGSLRQEFKIPLKGKIETINRGVDHYIRIINNNGSRLLKARYLGH